MEDFNADGMMQGGDGDYEQESVYMRGNVRLKKIQIEDDPNEYLMDDQGNIYDMNGEFVGTMDANELQ